MAAWLKWPKYPFAMTDKKYAMALKETKLNEEPLIGVKQVAI